MDQERKLCKNRVFEWQVAVTHQLKTSGLNHAYESEINTECHLQ